MPWMRVKQIQPFLPGGRVAGVIQVHQHHVEIARLERRQNPRGRCGRFDLESFALEQQPQRFEHVRLIVGDEHAPIAGTALHAVSIERVMS